MMITVTVTSVLFALLLAWCVRLVVHLAREAREDADAPSDAADALDRRLAALQDTARRTTGTLARRVRRGRQRFAREATGEPKDGP